MTNRRVVLGRLFTTFMLLGTVGSTLAPVSAATFAAGFGPTATSGLQQAERDCDIERFWHRGKLIATTKTCAYLYSVDPEIDLEDDWDYSVGWIQVRARPRNNWCVSEVRHQIMLDRRLEVMASAELTQLRDQKLRTARFKLSLVNQKRRIGESVAQSAVTKPGVLKQLTDLSKNRIGQSWKGKSQTAVTLVLGYERAIPLPTNPDDFFTVNQRASEAFIPPRDC